MSSETESATTYFYKFLHVSVLALHQTWVLLKRHSGTRLSRCLWLYRYLVLCQIHNPVSWEPVVRVLLHFSFFCSDVLFCDLLFSESHYAFDLGATYRKDAVQNTFREDPLCICIQWLYKENRRTQQVSILDTKMTLCLVSPCKNSSLNTKLCPRLHGTSGLELTPPGNPGGFHKCCSGMTWEGAQH